MLKLNETNNYLGDCVQWWLGTNNIEAIHDVMNDRYHYHEHQSPSMKIRQISSEVGHLGLKWATLASLADKIVVHSLFGPPSPGTYRALANDTLHPFTSLAFHSGFTITALISLGFAGHQCLNDAKEAKKSLMQSIQKDYDDKISINISDIGNGLLKLSNLSMAIPIYLSMRRFGLQGANIAAPLLYLNNIKEEHYSRNKTERLIKPAIVAASLAAGYLFW